MKGKYLIGILLILSALSNFITADEEEFISDLRTIFEGTSYRNILPRNGYCSGKAITCDSDRKTIKKIVLENIDLRERYLPTSLSTLSNLEILRLDNCQIKIHWNKTINSASLRSLRTLEIINNNALGELPTLDNLNLYKLDLSLNSITCQLSGFSFSKSLQYINLSTNNIYGRIEGGIFSELVDLAKLDLSRNNLTSRYVPTFSKNPKLSYLNISFNKLSGVVPSFSENRYLSVLSVANNRFRGLIPDFDKNPDLVKLELQNNKFSGFTKNLDNRHLKLLNASNNSISSIIRFNSNPALTHLDLSSNVLKSGTIEDAFNVNVDLVYLDLSKNKLNSSLPLLDKNEKLEYLNLSSNRFVGSMANLDSNKQLRKLDISNNFLSGNLKRFTTNHYQLTHIDLSNNRLDHKIPTFESAINLVYLNLSSNLFKGATPSFDFNKELIQLDLSYNYLSGVSSWFNKNQKLKLLNISHNQLSGNIGPIEIESLTTLNLAGNLLEGSIPKINGKNLKFLDLSMNQLSGFLPSFEQWSNLRILLLNDNDKFSYPLDQNTIYVPAGLRKDNCNVGTVITSKNCDSSNIMKSCHVLIEASNTRSIYCISLIQISATIFGFVAFLL